MPVSVVFITAVARQMADHLAETGISVEEAKKLLAQAGHRVTWSVCVDGEGKGMLPGTEYADHVAELGCAMGVSVARTVAAGSAPNGSWVIPLDGDDLLDPAGITELVEVLSTVPEEVAWVASNRVELDGSPGRSWVPTSRSYRPGELNSEYCHPYLFHPNNVAYRAEVVFETGGWPATPGGEDLALVLRVALRHAGQSTPIVTVLYRRWEKQTTANGSAFSDLRPIRHALYERFDLLGGRDPSW